MMTVQEFTSVEIVIKSGIFDATYYSHQAGRSFPGIESAVEHYLELGHAKQFNPHPLFDTKYYLEKYPDVAKAGVNPLLHYIAQGGSENRNPSEYFDGYFYLNENPEVRAMKGNPLSHFILIGAAQGKKPSAIFDTMFYERENPEVKELNLNPLSHYVMQGKSKGRRQNSRPLYPRDLYLRMRQLEPLLPQFETLQALRESKESFVSKPGMVYNKLKEMVIESFSHLFVVSNHSASLKNASDFATTLNQINLRNNVLIILSGPRPDNTDSEIEKFGLLNTVISLQNFGQKLEPEHELQIIVRLAIQAEPKVIHSFGSQVCLELFKRLHKPLSLKSKLFASATSFAEDSEGIPAGSNLHLSPCADALSAIFTEDQTTRAKLIELIGFEKEVAERITVCVEGEDIQSRLKQLAYFIG